jgi:hypothetical protein
VCENCGPINSIYANVWSGSATKIVSFDKEGNEEIEYDNHEGDECDGYYCSICDGDVDRDETIEVDEVENGNTSNNPT